MSPLERAFRARGVALVGAGPDVSVPAAFTDPGAEHLATRRAAGLFDFSFMGLFEIAGARALETLQKLQTRNLARIEPGRLAYTLLLREDGSVFVDATVWRLDENRYWLFTGRRSDALWIRERATGGCTPADCSGEQAVLALQGPTSARILARLAGEYVVRYLRYFRFAVAQAAGLRALVGRLGFSGELGYELVVPAAEGARLWNAVLEAGRAFGLGECGLDAADGLRIESGYVLFGREIDGADPFELGLGRLVEFDGRDFIGARALSRKRLAQPARALCGLETIERPALASGRADLPLARLTSERFSPLFGRRLALGFAAADARAGDLVRLADGRLARVVRLPFYDPGRHVPRAGRPLA